MKFSGLAVLALSLLVVPSSYADPVHVGTGGASLFESTLDVGQVDTFGFTLANDTQVTSLSFGIFPEAFGFPTFGTYSITLTGPGSTVYWNEVFVNGSATPPTIPQFLPAGSYTVDYTGIACTGLCSGTAVAGLDYYPLPQYFQTGGAVNVSPGSFESHLGWDLTGNTVANSPVPEPGTAALVGTGLLALAGIRRRFLNV